MRSAMMKKSAGWYLFPLVGLFLCGLALGLAVPFDIRPHDIWIVSLFGAGSLLSLVAVQVLLSWRASREASAVLGVPIDLEETLRAMRQGGPQTTLWDDRSLRSSLFSLVHPVTLDVMESEILVLEVLRGGGVEVSSALGRRELAEGQVLRVVGPQSVSLQSLGDSSPKGLLHFFS